MLDATIASSTWRRFHTLRIARSATSAMYQMNSTPCTQPTMRTACGMPAPYFSGIATKNSAKSEIPSRSATTRKRAVGDVLAAGVDKVRSWVGRKRSVSWPKLRR